MPGVEILFWHAVLPPARARAGLGVFSLDTLKDTLLEAVVGAVGVLGFVTLLTAGEAKLGIAFGLTALLTDLLAGCGDIKFTLGLTTGLAILSP